LRKALAPDVFCTGSDDESAGSAVNLRELPGIAFELPLFVRQCQIAFIVEFAGYFASRRLVF
jgi:hypothetical protein